MQFFLIDLTPIQNSSTYFNSGDEVVVCLVGNTGAWRYPELNAELSQYRTEIIRKMKLASKKVDLQFDENNGSYEYSEKLANFKD